MGFRSVAVAGFLAAGIGSAQAAEDYKASSLAEAVNNKCPMLNIIEYQALRKLTGLEFKLSPVEAAYQKGDKGAYTRFDADLAKQVAAIPCDPEAEKTIGGLRPRYLLEAAVVVMTVKLLDFHASSNPMISKPTADHLRNAAILEDYLGQVFGGALKNVAGPAQQIAETRLRESVQVAQSDANVFLLQVDAQAKLEAQGFRTVPISAAWIKLTPQSGGGTPVYIGHNSYCSGGKIIGFRCSLLVRDGKLYGFMEAPSYIKQLPQGDMTLYMRKPTEPSVLPDKTKLTNARDWRARTVSYAAKKGTAKFGEATLYEFEPAALTAFKNLVDTDGVDLGISDVPGGLDTANIRNMFYLTHAMKHLKAAP